MLEEYLGRQRAQVVVTEQEGLKMLKLEIKIERSFLLLLYLDLVWLREGWQGGEPGALENILVKNILEIQMVGLQPAINDLFSF